MGWQDPLEKGMTAHSSILAWRIPWTEEPGGPQSIGWRRVRHDRNNLTYIQDLCNAAKKTLSSTLCFELTTDNWQLIIPSLTFSSFKSSMQAPDSIALWWLRYSFQTDEILYKPMNLFPPTFQPRVREVNICAAALVHTRDQKYCIFHQGHCKEMCTKWTIH